MGLNEIFRRMFIPGPDPGTLPAGVTLLSSTWGNASRESVTPDYYGLSTAVQRNSIVFALIDHRIALFSQARFKFRRLSDKKLFGNSDLERLEFPWPNGTTGELLARMEMDVSVAGNAFIRDAGDQLVRLRPDWVTIVSEVTQDELGRPYRRVVGYYYDPKGDPDQEPAFYLTEEVVHWSPVPDPCSDFRGMSWLTPVVPDIDADAGLTSYKSMFLDNAATPNMVVKYQAKMKKGEVQDVMERLNARHAGVNNAFKTLVLDGGADASVVGASFNDMALKAVQGAGETRIAAAARVPASVVGFSEGLQGSSLNAGNYEAAMRQFGDLYGWWQWKSVCSALAKLVNVPPGTELWFDTSDISALRQGEKERADTVSINATSIKALIDAGYEPDAAISAVNAGDLTQLTGHHTGLFSVQLQPPNSAIQVESQRLPAEQPPALNGGPQ